MADVVVPRDVLENATNYVENALEETGTTETGEKLLAELDDLLSEPFVAGIALPREAIFQADMMASVIEKLQKFTEQHPELPATLLILLQHAVAASNNYTTYRFGDTHMVALH